MLYSKSQPSYFLTITYQQFYQQCHGHQRKQNKILSSSQWSVPPWCQCIRFFHTSQNTPECGTPQCPLWFHQQRSSLQSDGHLVYWSPRTDRVNERTQNITIVVVSAFSLFTSLDTALLGSTTRPSTLWGLAFIASSTSRTEEYVTKPNPLDRLLLGSRITCRQQNEKVTAVRTIYWVVPMHISQ